MFSLHPNGAEKDERIMLGIYQFTGYSGWCHPCFVDFKVNIRRKYWEQFNILWGRGQQLWKILPVQSSCFPHPGRKGLHAEHTGLPEPGSPGVVLQADG
jgi:hypothetical protein